MISLEVMTKLNSFAVHSAALLQSMPRYDALDRTVNSEHCNRACVLSALSYACTTPCSRACNTLALLTFPLNSCGGNASVPKAMLQKISSNIICFILYRPRWGSHWPSIELPLCLRISRRHLGTSGTYGYLSPAANGLCARISHPSPPGYLGYLRRHD